MGEVYLEYASSTREETLPATRVLMPDAVGTSVIPKLPRDRNDDDDIFSLEDLGVPIR